MKETVSELAHRKRLSPSLKETLRERFGRTTTTWQVEHARVLQSLQRAGMTEDTQNFFAKFMNVQAKAAGLSAVATDMIIGGAVAGVGAALIARRNPLKFTALGFLEIESKNLTKTLGLGAEAGAVGAVWVGPAQQASRLWARMYGSAMESAVDSFRLLRDRAQSS